MTHADRERLLARHVRRVLKLDEDSLPGDVIHEILRLQRIERDLRRFRADEPREEWRRKYAGRTGYGIA